MAVLIGGIMTRAECIARAQHEITQAEHGRKQAKIVARGREIAYQRVGHVLSVAMQLINDIERMAGVADRVAAYREYVEQHPQHPVAWFNLAVNLEEARDYASAATAARRVRSLSIDLYAMLPRRVRELARSDNESLDEPPAARTLRDYKILGIEWWTESHIMYRAVRVADDTPVTLRRVLDLSHTHARAQFEAAKTAVVDDLDGAPLQILPHVRGVPVNELTKAGELDVEVAMRVVRAAALECGKLHATGAVHADLRPEHVVRGERVAGAERVTLLGARMRPDAATPWGHHPVRSPEEDAGETIDARTDIYALGLLLYQLASGKPAPTLADRSAGILEPVAPDVDELIRRCLARDPEARFQTTAELIDAIEDVTARRTLPKQIGKWRIGAQLADTPLGRVYAADNTDIGELRAAVKVLDPLHARDPEARQRFLAEASAAGKLDHPGIARVFDGGTLADGTTYLAMEHIDGKTFAETKAVEPRHAAALGAETARALAAAHREGIVHGRLEAQSVVIASKAGDEHVKVRDFGARGDKPDDVAALGKILEGSVGANPPPALTALIARMRSEQKDERPTMDEVAAELDAIAKAPSEVALDTRPARDDASPRRKWPLVPIGVGALALVGIGVIAFAVAGRSSNGPQVRTDAGTTAAVATIDAAVIDAGGVPMMPDGGIGTCPRSLRFCMPIDDVFIVHGRGQVVTGTIATGVVRAGDRVIVDGTGAGRTFVVRGVQKFRVSIDSARRGEEVGLLLMPVDGGVPSNLVRGRVLVGER